MKRIKLINASIYRTSSSKFSQIKISGIVYTDSLITINNRYSVFLNEDDMSLDKLIGYVDSSQVIIINK